MIPGVICMIIRNFADLLKFEEQARLSTAPMVAVVGKDTAKLGLDVDRPCAAKRKIKLHIRLESQADMQLGDTDLREIPSDNSSVLEVSRIVDVACCSALRARSPRKAMMKVQNW